MASNIKMRVEAQVVAASLKKTKQDIENAVKSGFNSAQKSSKDAANSAQKAFAENFKIDDALKNAKIKLSQFSKILGDQVGAEFSKALSNIESMPNGLGKSQNLKAWGTQLKGAVVSNKQIIEAEKEALRLQMAQQKAAISLNNLREKNLNSLRNIDIKLDDIQSKVTNKEMNKLRASFEDVSKITDEVQKSKAISSLNIDIKNATVNSRSFTKELSNNLKKFAMWTSASTIIMKAVQALKQMLNTVIELDKAFTSIQMVTGYTSDQIVELKKQYTSLAKELRVSVTELAGAADAWLRMGYSAAEATEALTASVKFAKVALLDTSSATQYLVSAMKGYKLEIEDLSSISDMLNKVDMAAAVSAADLAEGMSEVASMAKLSGIEMSTLLGYLAAMGEVTQASGSETGTAMKSILSRMTKVAAGVETDEEGEDLNEVAIVLRKLGISLTTTTGDMRDMQEVLGDVAKAYTHLTTTEKNQLTTALGGTRMREKATVLLENYAHAMELADEAANSLGTTEEKYAAYTESIDAKMQGLTASFQELAQTTIDSGVVGMVVDIARGMLDIMNYTGGLIPSLITLIGLLKVIKAIKIAGSIAAAATSLTGIVGILSLVAGVVWGIVSAVEAAKEAQEEFRKETLASAKEAQKSIESLRSSYIELYNATEELADKDQKLISSWEKLTDLALKYGVAVDEAKNGYKDFLELSTDVEVAAAKSQIASSDSKVLPILGGFSHDENWLSRLSAAGVSQRTAYDVFGGSFVRGIRDRKVSPEEMQQLVKEAISRLASDLDASGKSPSQNKSYVGLVEFYKTLTNEMQDKVLAQNKINMLNEYRDQMDEALIIYQDFTKKEAIERKISSQEELNTLTEFITKVKSEYGDLSGYIDEVFAEAIAGYEEEVNKNVLSSSIKQQISLVKEAEKEYEAQNEELEKQKELQEKILSIQEAQKKLTEAQKKQVSVYREGKGFVYEADFSSVQDAQSELIKAKDELAEYKEELKFTTEIDQLNELNDAFERLFNNDSRFKSFANSISGDLSQLGGSFEDIFSILSGKVSGFLGQQGFSDIEGYIASLGITDQTQIDSLKSGFGYFETHHNGGIIGDRQSTFTGGQLKSDEVLAKLQKGEMVFNKQGQKNIVDSITNNNLGENVTYQIGNIQLPGVSNAKQFIEQLKALGRTSYQSVKKYV